MPITSSSGTHAVTSMISRIGDNVVNVFLPVMIQSFPCFVAIVSGRAPRVGLPEFGSVAAVLTIAPFATSLKNSSSTSAFQGLFSVNVLSVLWGWGIGKKHSIYTIGQVLVYV